MKRKSPNWLLKGRDIGSPKVGKQQFSTFPPPLGAMKIEE